jgi:hypothetical protein
MKLGKGSPARARAIVIRNKRDRQIITSLLMTEWIYDGRDAMDQACPLCCAYGPYHATDPYYARYAPGVHKEGCDVDGALTAVGLKDAGARDAARVVLGLPLAADMARGEAAVIGKGS